MKMDQIRMTEEEVELLLFESGLEHWIERIKSTLRLSDLTELSLAPKDKTLEVLNLVDSEIEKRALENVFKIVKDGKTEQNVHSVEHEHWLSILDSSQSDKVLVSAIKSKISEEDKEIFQATDPTRFEQFLKRTTHPNVNRVLTDVFTNITSKDDQAFESDDKTVSKSHEGEKQPLQKVNFREAAQKSSKAETVLKPVSMQSLRQEIQDWFKTYADINRQNVHTCVADLLKFKVRYEKLGDLWKTDVLYLRETQKRITSIVGILLRSADLNIQETISDSLRRILDSNIDRSYFPNIGYITKIFSANEGNPFKISNIQELTELLQSKVSKSPSETTLQARFEATIKVLSNERRKSYEYLVYIGVLQIFSFNTESFLFENDLQLKDFKAIINMLGKHMTNLEVLKEISQKQAYVLRLALFSANNRAEAIRYVLNNIPEGTCAEIRSFVGAFEQGIDFENLKVATNKLLPDGYLDNDLNTLAVCIRNRCHFTEREKNLKIDRVQTENEHLKNSVEKVLELLDMNKYYPQKLTLEEVTKLTESDFYVSQKPATLAELPWYFIKRLIGLDSNIRENCHIMNDSAVSDDSDSDDDYSFESNIHPEDLIYCIFLCADDFLRQELVDKMIWCQYAVPFILPSPTETDSRHLILHWALKSTKRTFYDKGQYANKTLVDIRAPLVTFMNIGEETPWKSRLLNKMLSPQQETFWHQELRGGNLKPQTSCGMVEVAWYLPGGHVDDKFPVPLTFANVRECVVNSNVSSQLINSSSLSCLFVEEISEEMKEFLHAQSTLERMLITVSHSKSAKEVTKQAIMKLKNEFNLHDAQIIRHRSHGSNFNAVYERIKGSLENSISHDIQTSAFSISSFANEACDHTELDNRKCYYGEQAAQSILTDIDRYIKNQKGTFMKTEILPFQSDRFAWKQMTALDKRNSEIQQPIYEDEVTHFMRRKEMNRRRLKELQEPLSDTFKYFLRYLVNSNDADKKYFLQCLTLGLSEGSAAVHDMHDRYGTGEGKHDRYGTGDGKHDRDGTGEGNPNLNSSDNSVIEDFFREMQMMYENISILQEMRVDPDERRGINEILDLLSGVGSDLLMNGTSVEIMDRESAHVPVKWLTAVFRNIEQRLKIFKVSALGGKSSGKSNVLRTTFGLNFTPGNGRSTKGTHMQLLKIDDPLKEKIKYDYIAVIDPPDLMPEANPDHSEADNRLSTFVVGLSDVTILVFTGKGIEMQDILSLSFVVFLRMNMMLGEHFVHFVHQNAEATMRKTEAETATFIRGLDEKTLVAAQNTPHKGNINKFGDIFQYDTKKNIISAPNFWDGVLPMRKTNSLYAKTMQQLKSDVLRNMEGIQKKPSRLVTLSDFTIRMNELWTAMNMERVLSLKNVSSVETYQKLMKVFDSKQWQIKRKVRDMISREEGIIGNDFKRGHALDRIFGESRKKLLGCIEDEIAQLTKEICHYFRCGGCDQCDTTVHNRHLLSNKEGKFLDSIQHLKAALLREIEYFLENLETKMKVEERINQLSKEMDDNLKIRIEQLVQAHKSKAFDRESLDEVFENMWTEATSSIIRSSPSSEPLLEKKRHGFHDLFLIHVGQVELAVNFCNHVLKEIILTNIDEKISSREVQHLLLEHPGGIFDSSKRFQGHMMLELLQQNTFQGFVKYITDYKTQAKLMFTEVAKQDDKLKEFAKVALQAIIDVIKKVLQETKDKEPFLPCFLDGLNTLKISHDMIVFFLEMKVYDPQLFVQTTNQCLEGSMKEELLKIIHSWDISKKIEEKGLTDILFKEIIGCDTRCPFCKVPCDAHSGDRTQGKHKATFHRPRGLGGTVLSKTSKLVWADCTDAVVSLATFCHPEDRKKQIPYKEYFRVYPDWSISPRGDIGKYWKFVFANYNEQFAHYYKAKPADIPGEWTKYTVDEVMEDVRKKYFS